MKSCCAFFAIFLTLAATGNSPGQSGDIVVGKTIMHPDGTKTESVSDPNTREMEQKTFDAGGVLLLRRLYRLNEKSLPVMGNIYDGSGNLIARTQSYFDAFGRMQEERLSNLQGEVFQQIVHEYDDKGKAKKPKVINYRVNSPTMRPAMMNFTQPQQPEPSREASGTGANRVKAPVNLEKSPSQPAKVTPEPPAEEPKKGFFQRLFKR